MTDKQNPATRKIGTNRDVERLWLEGKILLENGWLNGDTYDAIFTDSGVMYIKNPDGKRKVAGTPDRPIIDTNSKKIRAFAKAGEKVEVSFYLNSSIAVVKHYDETETKSSKLIRTRLLSEVAKSYPNF